MASVDFSFIAKLVASSNCLYHLVQMSLASVECREVLENMYLETTWKHLKANDLDYMQMLNKW